MITTREDEHLGHPRHGGNRQRPGRDGRGNPKRNEEIDQQRDVQQLLERRRPLDQGEVRPGVLEHHRLVDHRQLEVRRRIVHGNATGLGDQHDEESRQRQDVAGAKERAGRERAAHDRAEIERSGRERRREEPQHQGGFGERRNRHLAAAAHSSERAAGIEGGGRQRKAPERKDAHQSKDAAGALQGRRRHEHRDERRRRHGGGEVEARAEHVHPRGGLRSHRLLAKQLGEIVVPLQQRRSLPLLHRRLHLLDAASEEWRDGQQPRGLEHGTRPARRRMSSIGLLASQPDQQHGTEQQDVSEIGVETAGLQHLHPLGESNDAAHERVIEMALERRLDFDAVANLASGNTATRPPGPRPRASGDTPRGRP